MTRAVAILLAVALAPATGRAEHITVGVFAPSAPFPSTAARVELATRLGDHLGKALGGTGAGRVYARAGDFAAAVKRGEIAIALVDATYLASGGGGAYTVVATAVRSGGDGWQLVARDGARVPALAGKRLVVPSNGGRETDFVINVMLGGEVRRDHFAKIEAAADTASALASLRLGKGDAAVVPAGIDLPPGFSTVLAFAALGGPTLVIYGNAPSARRAEISSAAAGFAGDATITGFRGGDASGIRAISARFVPVVKRAVMTVPSARFVVTDLVENRKLVIERQSPLDLVKPR